MLFVNFVNRANKNAVITVEVKQIRRKRWVALVSENLRDPKVADLFPALNLIDCDVDFLSDHIKEVLLTSAEKVLQ